MLPDMDVRISYDKNQLKAVLGLLDPKQHFYAASLALNETAKETQARIRAELPRKYIIRNSWTAKASSMSAAPRARAIAFTPLLDLLTLGWKPQRPEAAERRAIFIGQSL